MADQPITGLPTKTASGVAATDKMLGIDSAEGYQILVRDVAKYIIENCNVSTLAGAVQTPKQAIDALNSNAYALTGGIVVPSGSDLNDYRTPGNYYMYSNGTVIHSPDSTKNNGFTLKVESSAGLKNDKYVRQTFRFYNDGNIYTRIYNDIGWETEWQKLPTRAEMDEVTSKQTFNITASTGTWPSEVTLHGGSYAQILGNTVMLHVNFKIISSTKKSIVISEVLPQNMRPRFEVMGIGGDGETDGLCQPFTVKTDGSIAFWNTKVGTSYLQGDFTYLVNTAN